MARAKIKPEKITQAISDANPGERPEVLAKVNESVLTLASGNTPVEVQSNFRKVVNTIGRMGMGLGKAVAMGLFRFAAQAIKNAAGGLWDELRAVTIPPLAYAKAYGLPFMAHLGTVAAGCGIIAGLTFLPPIIGTGASFLVGAAAAGTIYAGGKYAIRKTSDWAMNRAEKTKANLETRGFSGKPRWTI